MQHDTFCDKLTPRDNHSLNTAGLMNLLLPLFVIILFIAVDTEADVYREIDENGQVIFTDQPKKGAVKLPSKPLPVIPSVKISEEARTLNTRSQDDGNKSNVVYQCRIIKPLQDFTLTPDYIGDLPVVINLNPELSDDTKIRVTESNKIIFLTTQQSFVIPDMERGSYSLKIDLIDHSNNMVGQCGTTIVHVQRTRIR